LKSEEADQPHRLLLVAYPNRGSAASPKIGRGASHEWRIMQLLRIAYRQLDHEIRHLDRRIAAQREYLIRDLGPGFLAHELHTHLANLHDLHALMADDAKALLRNHPGDPKIQVTAERLLLAIQETTRLFHVVHGYNNMMRARQVEVFSLDEVVEEALALTRIRIREYAKAKSQVERKRAQAIRVESDHSLLLVVLVNVLVNASQAIYGARPPRGQSEPPPGGDRITILVESAPDDEQVVLLIANTGPAVSPELRERIFKRGYTTRPQGHGQGLFLCKQILENLGGDIAYVDPASHGLSPGAAFRIAFAQHCNKASNEGDRK
jgi:signal transduction histidine kinase